MIEPNATNNGNRFGAKYKVPPDWSSSLDLPFLCFKIHYSFTIYIYCYHFVYSRWCIGIWNTFSFFFFFIAKTNTLWLRLQRIWCLIFMIFDLFDAFHSLPFLILFYYNRIIGQIHLSFFFWVQSAHGHFWIMQYFIIHFVMFGAFWNCQGESRKSISFVIELKKFFLN